MNFDFKNGCKNKIKTNNEKNEADQEEGFLKKSISKSYGRTSVIPKALELSIILL